MHVFITRAARAHLGSRIFIIDECVNLYKYFKKIGEIEPDFNYNIKIKVVQRDFNSIISGTGCCVSQKYIREAVKFGKALSSMGELPGSGRVSVASAQRYSKLPRDVKRQLSQLVFNGVVTFEEAVEHAPTHSSPVRRELSRTSQCVRTTRYFSDYVRKMRDKAGAAMLSAEHIRKHGTEVQVDQMLDHAKAVEDNIVTLVNYCVQFCKIARGG
jgi:hypothetical protein